MKLARKKKSAKAKAPTSARKGGKRSAGRPPFQPTDEHREMAEALSGYGLTQREVASVIINPKTGNGIGRRTLQRYFPPDEQKQLPDTRPVPPERCDVFLRKP